MPNVWLYKHVDTIVLDVVAAQLNVVRVRSGLTIVLRGKDKGTCDVAREIRKLGVVRETMTL